MWLVSGVLVRVGVVWVVGGLWWRGGWWMYLVGGVGWGGVLVWVGMGVEVGGMVVGGLGRGGLGVGKLRVGVLMVVLWLGVMVGMVRVLAI